MPLNNPPPSAAGTALGQTAQVYLGADQSIATSIDTAVVWTGTKWDTDTMWAGGTPTRLTVKTAGKHLLVANICWTGNATGFRQVYFKLNGTTLSGQQDFVPFAAARNHITLAVTLNLALNDYVEVWVYQTSGSGLTVTSDAGNGPYFSMTRVG